MGNSIEEFLTKIREEGMDETVVRSFNYYYEQVKNGATGKLSEKEIQPPNEQYIKEYSDLENREDVSLDKLVVIKLNGGLGTSMGLKKAKSLLNVKEDNSFLDVIAKQILKLREKTNTKIPLVFMNSFNTRKDTLEFLKKYPDLKIEGIPLDFIQNKYPKIVRENLLPLNSKEDSKNWNPPGHGEIFTVLYTSGIIDTLLDKGYQYAFLSNSDNLGAISDNKILSYMKGNKIPFIMEVCTRTEMDKKGGHLAQTLNNQLVLRESAQCPDDEVDLFQNINRYKYFNTNNLWVDLTILKQYLLERELFLKLPLILNKKEVDNIPVYQIEVAMGAAIKVFTGAMAIHVPRSRFVPVKKTNELLAIWSDAYIIDNFYNIRLSKGLTKSPLIELGEYYTTIDQLSEKCKYVPSLKECVKLKVDGDFIFSDGVVFKGCCEIKTNEKHELNDIIIDNEIVEF